MRLSAALPRGRSWRAAKDSAVFLSSDFERRFALWGIPTNSFREGIKTESFVEGQNVILEFRSAEGQYDRLPGLAADLVSRKVSVIVAEGVVSAPLAAKQATTAIPIVFFYR